MKSRRPKPKAAPAGEVRDLIRGAGLRSTGPRVAVLRVLSASRTPLSHGEVAEKVEGDGLDKATVYRNLIDLAEVGILRRSDLGDHVWRFEIRREGAEHAGEHPHFMCVDCGSVECMPDAQPSLEAAKKAARAVGDVAEILLKGHCADCR